MTPENAHLVAICHIFFRVLLAFMDFKMYKPSHMLYPHILNVSDYYYGIERIDRSLEEKFTHLQSFFEFLNLNKDAITKQNYENDWSFEESILGELDLFHISLTRLMYDLSRCEKRAINAIVDQLAFGLDLHMLQTTNTEF
jgi:hypothetical protein